MARPQRNTVDYFPEWKPTRRVLNIIDDSIDRNLAFKAFRQSSSNFIKKHLVRKIILEKYNHKCCECLSENRLQIDHKISVYRCFKNKLFNHCNTEFNLQILCGSCNAAKLP